MLTILPTLDWFSLQDLPKCSKVICATLDWCIRAHTCYVSLRLIAVLVASDAGGRGWRCVSSAASPSNRRVPGRRLQRDLHHPASQSGKWVCPVPQKPFVLLHLQNDDWPLDDHVVRGKFTSCAMWASYFPDEVLCSESLIICAIKSEHYSPRMLILLMCINIAGH